MCLGHESSGEVVAVGPQVKGFKIKDRVALEVGVPCGSCTVCRKGRYNLCKKMRFRSSAKTPKCDPRLFQGTLQQRINHPAMWCHKYVFISYFFFLLQPGFIYLCQFCSQQFRPAFEMGRSRLGKNVIDD